MPSHPLWKSTPCSHHRGWGYSSLLPRATLGQLSVPVPPSLDPASSLSGTQGWEWLQLRVRGSRHPTARARQAGGVHTGPHKLAGILMLAWGVHLPPSLDTCRWQVALMGLSNPRVMTVGDAPPAVCLQGIWTSIWLPWWLSGKESPCQYRRNGFNPWVIKTP